MVGYNDKKQLEAYAYLSLAPGLKGLGHFRTCYEFLDNFIEVWIKFGFEEKQKGILIPRSTSKEAALMYYE